MSDQGSVGSLMERRGTEDEWAKILGNSVARLPVWRNLGDIIVVVELSVALSGEV